MKTPDEIKKGLGWCTNDSYACSDNCPYFNAQSNGVDCASTLHRHALAYINQLEADLARARKEYYALKADLYLALFDGGSFCDICKYNGAECDKRKFYNYECWEWRGVKEEEN